MTPPRLFPRQEEIEPTETEPERLYKYSDSYNSGNYQVGPHSLQTGYYPIPKNDQMAALEEGYYEGLTPEESLKRYRDKLKIPEEELRELRTEARVRPAGESPDTSQAMAEGQTNLGAFGLLGSANEAGLAAQKGDILGTIGHGLSAIGKGATMPGQILGMISNTAFKGIQKGLESLGIGGVGPTPSVGGSVPGGISLGIGTGGMDPSKGEMGLADIGVDPSVGFGGGGGDGVGGLGEGPSGQGIGDSSW